MVFMRFLIVLLCAFWPRGHLLLFFASLTRSAPTASKVSKRKATPVAGLATPNFPHYAYFWRRSRVAALRTTLVSAKTMLRSAAPRGRLHGFFVSGSLNKITCKLLHFPSECISSLLIRRLLLKHRYTDSNK